MLLQPISKILIFLDSHSQTIGILIMLITVWLMKRQIDVMNRQIAEMRNIEEEKRIIAVQALVEELKYNKDVITLYIQHSEEGGNVDPNKKGVSWEWNPPHFTAYSQYLNTACGKNIELAVKITSLYGKLESCKTIVYYIHQLLANNIIEVKTITGGDILLENIVKVFNKQICDISKEISNQFDSLITELENLCKSRKR